MENFTDYNSKLVGDNIINLQGKIYDLRGEKVMLDFDLAEIYGYTTKAFNQQINRNKEKFDDDFMFCLTRAEVNYIVRSQFVTSRSNLFSSQSGGSRYLPRAFTESGIYMLMTVLKGDLATKQSKALIRTFRAMKNYLIENQTKLNFKNGLELSIQTAKNTRDILSAKAQVEKLDFEIKSLASQIHDTVKKSALSPIFFNFNQTNIAEDFIFLNNEFLKSDDTYINIYAKAKAKIYIIDNYVNIKTLRHLQKVKPTVKITIFSDNLGNYLHASDYCNFRKEFPNIKIDFIKTMNKIHDRFIIIDHGLKTEKIFHCGASEKDAGSKITVISELKNNLIVETLDDIISLISNHPKLILRS